jgi:hypothetical protein
MRTCCESARGGGGWFGQGGGVDIDVGESGDGTRAWSWAYRSQMRLARGWNNFTRPGVCLPNARVSSMLSPCPTLASRGSKTVFWESGRTRDEQRECGGLIPCK